MQSALALLATPVAPRHALVTAPAVSDVASERDIVKRALCAGGGFQVFSLVLTGRFADPITNKKVTVEGMITEAGGVHLFAGSVIGSNKTFFVDELLTREVCAEVNERSSEQLAEALEKRCAAA